MRRLFLMVGMLYVITTFATSSAIPTPEQKAQARQDAAKRMMIAREKKGGIVISPKSFKGKVVIIDTQSKADIKNAFAAINEKLQCHLPFNIICVSASDDTPEKLKEKFSADFVIIVADDESSTATLIAPEERWAKINVAKYSVGLKSISERKNIYNDRCAKAVLKAFALLCGGGGSRYKGHVAAATSIPSLDLAHDQLPYDIQQGVKNYLTACGVTPLIRTTYERACHEGWAPAPTNDIQKAIWDKVHAMPTAPIKIKPETKKVRE